MTTTGPSRRSEHGHTKVLFDVENEDGSIELESMWAVPVPNGYRIDNIPFYARGIAWGDLVSAAPDEGGMLRFTELVAASGHSTVRLWFEDHADVAAVREILRSMGCPSELAMDRLVAVDVPPSVPYASVRSYLHQQQAAAVFEYEEGCLGQG